MSTTANIVDAQLLAEKIEAVLHIYEESQKVWNSETGMHKAMRMQYADALQKYFEQGAELLGDQISSIEELEPAMGQRSHVAIYPYARALAFLLRRHHDLQKVVAGG